MRYTEQERRQIEQTIGTRDQWDRARTSRDTRRAEAAYRNARQCGTDPSWYGF